MSWTRYDVFISYSHQDSASTAPLVAALRQRGYRVFYDKSSIQVGEQWKIRLGKAVGASRVCILCWSASARDSEFVAFEHSRAAGLGKPVLPWLIDGTPLPKMLDIQAVTSHDPAQAAVLLLPQLGWTLALRRKLQALACLLVLVAGAAVYWRTHLAPPPWTFTGRVTDSETKFPIAGVEVDAEQRRYHAFTDSRGVYTLQLPAPQPRYIDLVFLKEGYKGEVPVNVSSSRPFDTDMTRLK
jgi:hypothetical protein